MKDPGNPRREPGQHREQAERRVDVLEIVGRLTRGLCLICVFALLVAAAGLAVTVFFQIGRLIQDPAAAKSSVEAIAELISAESLSVIYAEDETLQFSALHSKSLWLVLLGSLHVHPHTP